MKILHNGTSLPAAVGTERTITRSLVVVLPWGRDGELVDACLASPAGRGVTIASRPGWAGAIEGGNG